MAFVGVEFPSEGGDGNSVALVSRAWLTPLKKEVFWPSFKLRIQFEKTVRSHIAPEDSWQLYPMVHCFFECDDYDKAQYKIKQAEITSDIQSELEEPQAKRKRVKPRRLSYGSSDVENSCSHKQVTSTLLQRPPPLKFSIPQTLDVSNDSQSQTNSRTCFDDSTFYTNKDLCIGTPPVLSPSNTNTKHDSVDNTAFHRKLFTLLHKIEEQNKLILNKLDTSQQGIIVYGGHLPQNMPVALPIRNYNEIIALEDFLKNKENFAIFSSHVSSLGGRDLVTKVNIALKTLITDAIACNYSFYGKRSEKQPFGELLLKKVIVDAIKNRSPDAFEKNIEAAMKIWLKHEPQHLKQSQK